MVIAGLLVLGVSASAQPLIDYVSAPDASFTWSVSERAPLPTGATLVKVDMTSQTWQNIPWTHHLWVMIPPKLEPTDKAVLVITGGNPEAQFTTLGAAIADQAKTIVAVLWNIPNQPLFGGRSEDALIAHTFVRFLETRDESWPLLFPMTKAAVRAMDVVQALATEAEHPVDGFVVTGASKRGWTTWMTAAADPRVAGIAPMVYDNLNLGPQMAQQKALYKGYSEQIQEYTEYDLQDMLQSEEGAALGAMVDPYTFRETLTMPKLIINGSNDPYWTLESSRLYFDDLPGRNTLHFSPNGGHDLGGMQPAITRIVPTVVSFVRSCGGHAEFPNPSWRVRETNDGTTLIIDPKDDDAVVGIWTTATNVGTIPEFESPDAEAQWIADTKAKDFRGCKWEWAELMEVGGEYRYHLPRRSDGFAAMIGEIRYRVEGRATILSTTPYISD